MKLATWNVNSLKVRLPHVLDWLAANPVDVLCLQETKQQDEDFPQAELQAAGYHSVFRGQKTYNGVAILSRAPGRDETVFALGQRSMQLWPKWIDELADESVQATSEHQS